jgi:hypothetical protein
MDYKDAATLSLLSDAINHSQASTINAQTAAINGETAAAMATGLAAVVQQRNALLAEVAELKRQLAVAQANAVGISAQARALLAENPNTALMGDSGVAYKSKEGAKTKLRCIYEEAFDVAARKRGIEHPEQHREN